MTEQELIDTINALIDADVQAGCPELRPKDIARRALDRCGEVFEPEAVADLADQILSARCEPWKWPPGARPRLKGWKDGISRLDPKPSVAEILEAGRQAGEPIAVTLARVRRAYPRLTEAAMDAEIEAYLAWLQKCGEELGARARELAFEKIGCEMVREIREAADP